MDTPEKQIPNTVSKKNKKYWCSIRRLRLSLKYRPEILKLILKMRQCIRNKNALLKKLNHQLRFMEETNHLQVKKVYNQSDSNNLLSSRNNAISEQDDLQKLIKDERSAEIISDTLTTENNLGSNVINTDVTLIKSTSYDDSVQDSFSQTMTKKDFCNNLQVEESSKSLICTDSVQDNNILLNIPIVDSEDKILTTENKLVSCQQVTDEINTKEANTQTELSFDNFKKIKKSVSLKDSFSQTECIADSLDKRVANDKETKPTKDKIGWSNTHNGEEEKSIADQVKEVAQSAMQQSGMVYVESAGMYYDYKTGYYYNSELGLYYHTDTGCYYFYSDEQKTFVFHSYPERSTEAENRPAKPIRKSKIHRKDEADGDASKPKRRKLTKRKRKNEKVTKDDVDIKKTDHNVEEQSLDKDNGKENDLKKDEADSKPEELEDGECSNSSDEKSDSAIDESDASTATASDDESVAKHHPPCMRVIVRETNLPKLKVGSLFLVTKDGGTVGREGEHHAILLKDYNVSRNHLDIKFNAEKRIYTVVDMGSKNGTILNGVRMSESQEVSDPMEVLHGSTIQLGETKLLCHIHAGNDTCGHCEPGLIMEAEDKEKKVAYTRTCSVQIQHQLELARLKNKYAPQPLQIMDTEYNDRAQARREKVGSSHHAEKTQSSDLDTAIAADNKGFKLLEKMGWSKGEGLGKDSQGDTEPIPLISNEGKSGLGAAPAPFAAPTVTSKLGPATMRLAAKTKMLQPPAKAFQQPAEDDSE